jgi:small subunit ribosomal protein S20
MPQRRTAKKELRKTKKRREQNLRVKGEIKSVVKKFKKSLQSGDAASRKKELNEVYKTLDKAAKKKIIHPNKAARKKSRLSKLLKS